MNWKAIKKSLFIAASAAFWCSAAFALGPPPGTPELLKDSRVKTPREVQLYMALEGDDAMHDFAGAVVLEPILFKCMNGVPANYLVITYKGSDEIVRQGMEEVIALLNAEDGFEPLDLDAKINGLEPYFADFGSFGLSAWVTGVSGLWGTGYAPPLLVNYHRLLKQVEEKGIDLREYKKSRVYTAALRRLPLVIGFKKKTGEGVYFFVGPNFVLEPYDDEKVLADYNKSINYIKDMNIEHPDFPVREKEFWDNIETRAAEAPLEGKYFKVLPESD